MKRGVTVTGKTQNYSWVVCEKDGGYPVAGEALPFHSTAPNGLLPTKHGLPFMTANTQAKKDDET